MAQVFVIFSSVCYLVLRFLGVLVAAAGIWLSYKKHQREAEKHSTQKALKIFVLHAL